MPIALLHSGIPIAPHDLAGAWSFDAGVIILLVASAVLYGRGVDRLWARAGAGHGVRRWQAWCFAGGWLTLVVALVSPLHAMGEALFSAHMAQHELLVGLAAPLLVLGRPLVPALFALPLPWRRELGRAGKRPVVRGAWRVLTSPPVAWLLHAIALWAWHLPALYQATLTSELVHSMQHASFLGTGLLFWWALIHHRDGRMGYGASVFYVFTTALHTGALGALLTFAPGPWYPAYEGATEPWGLALLEDQQLAGLIMWVPASFTYLIAALVLIVGWLHESERRAERWQRPLSRVPHSLGILLALALPLAGCGMDSSAQSRADAAALTGGRPERGPALMRAYGCVACHEIPGVAGANGMVGPPLTRIAERMYLAGRLPNTPDNMMRWIRDPQAVDSLTAMPNTGVTAEDVRHIAAYLYTLHD